MAQEIQMISVSKLKPYERNPRKNDGAVDAVAESIRQFGFKVPIVVDSDMVIITGHTRLKAAKRLKMKQVPVIIADDLTEEQAQAFRLADNKTSELAFWDTQLLGLELSIVGLDYDMTNFGFGDLFNDDGEVEQEIIPTVTPGYNAGDPEDDDYLDDPDELDLDSVDDELDGPTGRKGEYRRERTVRLYRLDHYNPFRVTGKYEIPTIQAVDHVPKRLMGFNYAKSRTETDADAGIHFYLDDYLFERIWVNPDRYIEILQTYDCVLSPDFSLYMNMPMAMKIWNTYRSRLIGQILQDNGIIVIPTLSWAEPETFEFCFDGLSEGGVISVSTIGVKRSDDAMDIWTAGMDEALTRLKPSHIVVYGGAIDYDFGNVPVTYYENEVTERMKAGKDSGW